MAEAFYVAVPYDIKKLGPQETRHEIGVFADNDRARRRRAHASASFAGRTLKVVARGEKMDGDPMPDKDAIAMVEWVKRNIQG